MKGYDFSHPHTGGFLNINKLTNPIGGFRGDEKMSSME
jgi:hypothetical protein